MPTRTIFKALLTVLAMQSWSSARAAAPTGAAGHNDVRSDDATEIQAFLHDPDTHVFPEDGLQWVRRQEFLRKGTQIQNGCVFSESCSSTDPECIGVSEEIAVNRRTCVSLIRAGQLTPESWAAFQRMRHRPGYVVAGIFYGVPLIIGTLIGSLIVASMAAARAILVRHSREG